DLDRASAKQPGRLCRLMNRLPGLPDEIPGERLRQAAARFAVGGAVGGDLGEVAVVAVFLESVDGLVARRIRGEHLGEEHAERDPGRVDPLAPLMADAAAGRSD